jgi:hypothetical protein
LSRAAGIHHHRVGFLDRLRLQPALFDLVELAFVVELFFAGPKQLDDLEPFDGAVITRVVLELLFAEHLDLGLVPAGDDIEVEATAGHMIDGRGLLGGHDGMDGRHMRGGKDARIPGRSADRRRPRKRFEALPVEVGHAAESFPTADRHQRLELHLIAHACQRERIRPGRLQHPLDAGDGAAAAEIGAEGAELELAMVEQRIGRFAQLIGSCLGVHDCPQKQDSPTCL